MANAKVTWVKNQRMRCLQEDGCIRSQRVQHDLLHQVLEQVVSLPLVPSDRGEQVAGTPAPSNAEMVRQAPRPS